MRKLFSPAPLFPSYLQASASGVRKLLSRIGFRLMAFNVLLLFLPFAGILYLGLYEDRLEAAQRRSMAAQARLLSAALSNRGPVNSPESQRILSKLASTTRNEPRARLRVIDTHGHIIADSLHADLAETASRGRTERIRQNWLYRIGAALVRPINRLLTRAEPPLQPAEDYEKSNQLMGPEVQAALRGEYGTDKRSMQSIRSVLLYGAVPITDGPRVIGVAHASQSTFAILQDLYPLRLGLVRIFVVSLVVAVILSLLVSMTIVRPLRRLRQDAGVMVDGRGRLRGMFQGSGKLDEIGDLSRALERLTRRLDGHVRFIESFASDVSHEFKNPLASIRTASEMLGEVEEPAERRRFRKMVDQEIARMENLLSGVREITFIDSQMATEAMTTVAVDQLLAQIVEGFKLRSLPKFEVKSDGGAMVKANAERLTQVFENVLDNAVSFSAPGQTISVETESKDGTVITRIADQGPGIPAAHMEKIFDRFFTYREGTDKRRTGHTGLGLAIVRAIVEGYGGTITAANRPDGGAVFEIHLPASRS